MDMENAIKGLQECDLNGGMVGNCPYKDAILSLLKEQGKEIEFLKEMQLRTVKVMDEDELGRIVAKTLGEFR